MAATIEYKPTPFAEGEGASRSGLPITANPYNGTNVKAAQEWYAGYAAHQRRTHPYHK